MYRILESSKNKLSGVINNPDFNGAVSEIALRMNTNPSKLNVIGEFDSKGKPRYVVFQRSKKMVVFQPIKTNPMK